MSTHTHMLHAPTPLGAGVCAECGVARVSSRSASTCWTCQHPPCAVCLTELTHGKSCKLACGHELHAQCLERLRIYKLPCPLCRAPLCSPEPRDDEDFVPARAYAATQRQEGQEGQGRQAPPRPRRASALGARRRIRRYALYLSSSAGGREPHHGDAPFSPTERRFTRRGRGERRVAPLA